MNLSTKSVETRHSIFVPAKVNTRRKQRGLIRSVYTRTKLCQRSLKISILKLHNWLKGKGLLPETIEKVSKASLKKIVLQQYFQ